MKSGIAEIFSWMTTKAIKSMKEVGASEQDRRHSIEETHACNIHQTLLPGCRNLPKEIALSDMASKRGCSTTREDSLLHFPADALSLSDSLHSSTNNWSFRFSGILLPPADALSFTGTLMVPSGTLPLSDNSLFTSEASIVSIIKWTIGNKRKI